MRGEETEDQLLEMTENHGDLPFESIIQSYTCTLKGVETSDHVLKMTT